MRIAKIMNSIAQPFMAGYKVESLHKQGIYALTICYGNAARLNDKVGQVNGVHILSEFVFPAINGLAIGVRNVSN